VSLSIASEALDKKLYFIHSNEVEDVVLVSKKHIKKVYVQHPNSGVGKTKLVFQLNQKGLDLLKSKVSHKDKLGYKKVYFILPDKSKVVLNLDDLLFENSINSILFNEREQLTVVKMYDFIGMWYSEEDNEKLKAPKTPDKKQ
jgi:hypothetical protein